MEKHKNTINTIKGLVNKNSISSTEFRYICARVRIVCKLVIPKRPKTLPAYLTASELYFFLD